MLAPVRLPEVVHPQIQHHIDAVARGGRGEAQQRPHQLPHPAVVVVHIRPGLVKVEVLGQHGLSVEHRGLVIDEAFQIDIQGPGNVIQRLHVDGNGAVFILGHRGLAFVDHGRELLDGIAPAFAVFFDPLAHMVGKGTHSVHLLVFLPELYQTFGRKSTKSFRMRNIFSVQSRRWSAARSMQRPPNSVASSGSWVTHRTEAPAVWRRI